MLVMKEKAILTNEIIAEWTAFLPAMNGYCLQLELLMTAWKSDLADKSILGK